MSMKKLKDLTAIDFPGVDAKKFGDWKDAELQLKRGSRLGIIIAWPALIVILILIAGATQFSFIGVLVGFGLGLIGYFTFLMLYLRPLANKARDLGEKAGIDRGAV